MNLGQQVGGQQAMAYPMFPRDHAPQRHVEAYEQVPDPQPVHRQDADAYWADKIAEVMRDQFGIKPKVNTYSYRTPYPPAYDLIPLLNRYKVPDFTKFSGQDDPSTMEHVNRFIIQCGEAANRDKGSFILVIFIWIGLHLVYLITSKLSDQMGRSRKIVPQIFLF